MQEYELIAEILRRLGRKVLKMLDLVGCQFESMAGTFVWYHLSIQEDPVLS